MLHRIALLAALFGNLFFCFALPWLIDAEIPTEFRQENIINLDKLVSKLLLQEDSLSQYLYSRFPTETKEMLKTEKKQSRLIEAILKEINKILDEENFQNLPEFQKSLEDFGENRKYFYASLLQKEYQDCLSPVSNYWIHHPTFRQFLLFGTYKQENLMYIVSTSSGIALSIGFFSLLISIVLGILFIFLEFHPTTSKWAHTIEKILGYFPRLFLLIFFCALFKLQETSQLSWDIRYYLMAGLGVTGAIFISSQTYEEICELKEKLFVSFAYSLGYSSFMVFLKHILHNCSSLPVSIVKQMRDNILFLSILTFIGVVHLQPEDLGSVIFKLYNTAETFFQGWWILFFPCAFLTWLIFFFDLLGEELKRRMEKRKISIIK